MSRYCEFDAIILEVSPFMSDKIDLEEVRKSVADQISENGVAILPIGVKATTAKQVGRAEEESE